MEVCGLKMRPISAGIGKFGTKIAEIFLKKIKNFGKNMFEGFGGGSGAQGSF